MYKIFKPIQNVEGIQTIHLISENNKDTFVAFNIIDVTNQELINKLGIIKGDIYDVCNGVVNQYIVICDWSENFLEDAIHMIEDYRDNVLKSNQEDTPIFLIFRVDYPNSNNIIGQCASLGFQTADHLVDLDNNFAMVKTHYRKFKELSKNYVVRQLKKGF